MNIMQIGVGGIGGYLALFLSKFLQNVNSKRSTKIGYCIWDGDVVEEKNILRQNFDPWNVGENKAACIGNRYGIPYIESNFLPISLMAGMDKSEVNVLLTCVDSLATRLRIYNTLVTSYKSYNWVLIDGGNTDTTGQVIVAHNNSIYNDKVSKLPSVDFEKFFEGASDGDSYIPSCAELGDQSIMVNLLAASNMYNIVTELITTGKISMGEVRFTRYSWVPVSFDMNNAVKSKTL